jgi:hypothetical protein
MRVLPNTYEAPTCQEAKGVRRKMKGSSATRFSCSRSALAVADFISSSGFAGTCAAPNTYRGSTLHEALKRWRM